MLRLRREAVYPHSAQATSREREEVAHLIDVECRNLGHCLNSFLRFDAMSRSGRRRDPQTASAHAGSRTCGDSSPKAMRPPNRLPPYFYALSVHKVDRRVGIDIETLDLRTRANGRRQI